MRIGGGICRPWSTPGEWLAIVKDMGASAALFPLNADAPKDQVRAFYEIAGENDLVLSEVGIWRDLVSSDEEERKQAIDYAMRELALADEVRARCAVTVSGSKGTPWYGYHPGNFEKETYAQVVETVQMIIDAVSPKYTSFALEPMPWMVPSSPEEYLQLIKDVNREHFKAHLDFANMTNSVEKYVHSAASIHRCFELLGPYIVSIHAKDLLLSRTEKQMVISEVIPGDGELDMRALLLDAAKLDPDLPIMSEHISTHEGFCRAIDYLKQTAEELGLSFR